MRIPRRALAGLLFGALGTAALLPMASPGALAQAPFPSKPVRVIVGFTAGSSTDVGTRVVAQKMGELLGQPVVVENRPGAGSNIGTELVVRAPADGYTLLSGTIANTINSSLYRNLGFDFARDLSPVGLIGTLPNILVVHPSLKVADVARLIALAKAQPERIAYASSGSGTAPHLSGELFNSMAGVRLIHVPYKGSSQALTDLLAGQVGVMFAPAPTVLGQIKAGALSALAVTTARRTAVAPDLPTLAESGLAGFDTGIWFGLLAPAGTPAPVIARLAEANAAAVAAPDVVAQLAQQGIEPLRGGPPELGAMIQSETTKWAEVIRVSGAKVD